MKNLYDLDRTLINPDNEIALAMIKQYIDDNENCICLYHFGLNDNKMITWE